MIKDPFGNELLTIEIEALFKYMSAKAIFVELKDGRHKWIPKSLIYNEFDWSNKEDPQVFVVLKKFVEQNDMNNW